MAPYVIFTSTVRGRGIPRIPLAQTRSCGQSWKLTKHLMLEQLWEHLAQALSWQGNCGPLSHGWLMTALGVKFNNSVPIQGILSFQGNNSLYIGPKKQKKKERKKRSPTITWVYFWYNPGSHGGGQELTYTGPNKPNLQREGSTHLPKPLFPVILVTQVDRQGRCPTRSQEHPGYLATNKDAVIQGAWRLLLQ